MTLSILVLTSVIAARLGRNLRINRQKRPVCYAGLNSKAQLAIHVCLPSISCLTALRALGSITTLWNTAPVALASDFTNTGILAGVVSCAITVYRVLPESVFSSEVIKEVYCESSLSVYTSFTDC
jgi:hypothetical protein